MFQASRGLLLLLIVFLTFQSWLADANPCMELFAESIHVNGTSSRDDFQNLLKTETNIKKLWSAIDQNPELAIKTLIKMGYNKAIAKRLVQTRERAVPYILGKQTKLLSPNKYIYDNGRSYNPHGDPKSSRKTPITVYRGLRFELDSGKEFDSDAPDSFFEPKNIEDFRPSLIRNGIIWVTPGQEYAESYAAGANSGYSLGSDAGFVLVFQIPEFLLHWRGEDDFDYFMENGESFPDTEAYLIKNSLNNQVNYLVGVYEVVSSEAESGLTRKKFIPTEKLPENVRKKWGLD